MRDRRKFRKNRNCSTRHRLKSPRPDALSARAPIALSRRERSREAGEISENGGVHPPLPEGFPFDLSEIRRFDRRAVRPQRSRRRSTGKRSPRRTLNFRFRQASMISCNRENSSAAGRFPGKSNRPIAPARKTPVRSLPRFAEPAVAQAAARGFSRGRPRFREPGRLRPGWRSAVRRLNGRSAHASVSPLRMWPAERRSAARTGGNRRRLVRLRCRSVVGGCKGSALGLLRTPLRRRDMGPAGRNPARIRRLGQAP